MKYILCLLIIFSLIAGCTKRNVSKNKQPASCTLSDLSIFPHPNDAGVTLAILAIDKQTKKNRIIRIGDEVCEGYKLYKITPHGIELKNNDGQTEQIAYAKSDVLAEPVVQLEQANRQAVKKAEQLQKYGIPQAVNHIQVAGTRENTLVNSFAGTRFTANK